jgi:hypothetical protein
MNYLKISVYASLFVQILTGIIDYYVITLPIDATHTLLRQLLIMEFFVQTIEATFYIWLALSISFVTNITYKRYWDWFISTPTMLITFSAYLVYLRITERGSDVIPSLYQIIDEYLPVFVSIVLLNASMLLFGYLGEINKMTINMSVFFGFIPFIVMFYLIYEFFAKYTSYGLSLYWYFAIIWALYGIAALFSYKLKNISYNILDLFSKNFFGLFLAYVLYNKIHS